MPDRATRADVGVFVGSLRRDSHTRKVARALIEIAPPRLQLGFVEIGTLPFYNQDLEESVPPAWAEFRARVRALNAVLFVTPEYNRGMPAALKNAIDVGSRPPRNNVWSGKPGGVVSVTTGGYGAMASHHQLRQVLMAVNVQALALPEMYVANIEAALGPEGTVTNEKTIEFLRKFVDKFATWIDLLAPGSAGSP